MSTLGTRFYSHSIVVSFPTKKSAVLSYCQGEKSHEVMFGEMKDLSQVDEEARDRTRERPGYEKMVATQLVNKLTRTNWSGRGIYRRGE